MDSVVKLVEQLKQAKVVEIRGRRYRELINANIVIENPRNRFFLERHPTIKSLEYSHYAVAQLLWYLAGNQNLWIKQFCPEMWARVDQSAYPLDLNSNYGQYIFRECQFRRCIETLKNEPTSRRAVILINRPDIAMSNTTDHLCTTSIQFLVRDGQCHMIVTMRSNELFCGFFNDMAFFTFLQEVASCLLGVSLGSYYHNVGSFHAFQDEIDEFGTENIKRPDSYFYWPHISSEAEAVQILNLPDSVLSGPVPKHFYCLSMIQSLIHTYGFTTNLGT